MKHTHQYKKIKQQPSGRTVWRCMIANCSHYTTPEFILGKYSICPACERQFIIDKVARERTFPKCQECRGRKKSSSESSTVVTNEFVSATADILKKFGVNLKE